MLRDFESAGFVRVLIYAALIVVGAYMIFSSSPSIVHTDHRGIWSFLQ